MSPLSRQLRWERRTEWPLATVAVVFLAAYSVQVLAQPRGSTARLLDWIMDALYVAFAIDYLARLALADQRAWWFFRHLPELIIVALPFLRPLRVLRLIVLVEAVEKLFGDALRGRIVVYTAFSAVMLIYAAALGVLDVERPKSQGNIKNFGDTPSGGRSRP